MVATLEHAGFYVKRTRGDHKIMRHKTRNLARPVIVPMYRELPDGVVSNNLRTAGISRKDYAILLGRGRDKRRERANDA